VSIAQRQLEMLRRMAALRPAPCFMGGYAKEALLAGAVTCPQEDFDWLLPRSEYDLRLAQARELGFGGFETIGEAAPDEPFYLASEAGDLKLELGICDAEDGGLWMKVHALSFDAPADWRARLPGDTFAWPPVEIDGIRIRVASPLALYQMEVAIAGQGSFGELAERHRETTRELRQRFFPERSDAAIAPRVERLD
jgi:hypothetical protein